MDDFTIQIAGLNARVQPLFSSTREYCRSYLSNMETDVYIEVTKQDLAATQAALEREAIEDGIRVRKFPEPFLERATIQRKIAEELLNRDTILFHGSTVGLDGTAYLFTAPCGTGKSTHTRFWREVFGHRAVMVNDDKPFLQITATGVIAHGSPWSGKHGLDTNIFLPLKGICLLRRGTDNRIQRMISDNCINELYHQCYLPDDLNGQERVLELVNALAQIVPLWEMECIKDSSAALVSYSAMSR